MPKNWQKKVHKLGADHKWKAKEGYQIFVADGGALRFDIPIGWVVVPGETSFKFHDQEPPDDECVVEVTVNWLPPADFSEFPLATALADVLRGGYESATARGDVVTEQRGETRLAWAEIRYVDDTLLRPAIAQTLLGLRGVIQILLTMAYWVDDAEQFTPVWEEILRSIRLGEAVDFSGRRQPTIVPRGYG